MNRLASVTMVGLFAAGLAACGGDDTNTNNNSNNNTNNNNNNNNNTCSYDTVAKVQAFLEGKTLLMAGDAVPSHPNGFDRNVNFGAYTQCVASTKIEVINNAFKVVTDAGVLTGAPAQGDVGTCDTNTVGAAGVFDATSTGVLIENVASDCSCFDITVTYAGFVQEGRAMISADGTKVDMEFYFQNQATGHRCADGAVGAATVTLNATAFTGDAVQVYTVQ
jgi:hypothetical protein